MRPPRRRRRIEQRRLNKRYNLILRQTAKKTLQKKHSQDLVQYFIKVTKPMRKRLTLPDEVCEKQETNKKMIRSRSYFHSLTYHLLLLRCARVLERIVNQNNFSDIALGMIYLFISSSLRSLIVQRRCQICTILSTTVGPSLHFEFWLLMKTIIPHLQRFMKIAISIPFPSDFRFYEDQADDLRETEEGTMLPLWKFLFEKVS